jgi:hypothetical protein
VQKSWATKFSTVVSNIFWSSVWNLLHATLLVRMACICMHQHTHRHRHIVRPSYSTTVCSLQFVVLYPGWQQIEIWYNREFLFTDFHRCQVQVVPYCEVLYQGSTVNCCYVIKLSKSKVEILLTHTYSIQN